MKNTTNIVHTISNIFAEALERREIPQTYKQAKVIDS